MAKRVVFRCDLCHCARRADVVLGTQHQSQDRPFNPNILQRHQSDCLLVCHRESHRSGSSEVTLTVVSVPPMKGNFYLFFVILSSSLESPNFHMGPIRYLNSVVQVSSSTRAGIIRSHLNSLLVLLGFHRHCLFPVLHGQQTTIVSSFRIT
jgi:hypothetical protein